MRHINVHHQEKEAVRLGTPRGNLSDLYPRWLGARELLLRGRDPYSQEVTSEIQRGYYGRELDPSRPNDPKDLEAFAYPIYVVFVLAPTVHMDFATIRLLALWLLTAGTILSVLLWQQVMGVKFSWLGGLTVILLVLGCYPFVEGIALQQLSLLVAALLSCSFLMRKNGRLFASGVLLAIATIKPHVAFLPVILMLMWVSGNWRERQRWLWGFVSTLILLVGASEYLLSGWMFRFYDATRSYTRYIGGTSFLDLLLTSRWGGTGRALIVLIVLWVCWQARRLAPETLAARRALSLVLVAAVC
ncbi:MAG TPA: glycosyltransferase family 87 protein, partial [Ktedonobacteraceae bacterium]